jgi:hypothetical protein
VTITAPALLLVDEFPKTHSRHRCPSSRVRS